MNCMNDLIQIAFKIRGLERYNHSTNVAAFNILLNENDADHRAYIFFDSVHLVKKKKNKNKNNLLNEKKLCFRNLISLYMWLAHFFLTGMS